MAPSAGEDHHALKNASGRPTLRELRWHREETRTREGNKDAPSYPPQRRTAANTSCVLVAVPRFRPFGVTIGSLWLHCGRRPPHLLGRETRTHLVILHNDGLRPILAASSFPSPVQSRPATSRPETGPRYRPSSNPNQRSDRRRAARTPRKCDAPKFAQPGVGKIGGCRSEQESRGHGSHLVMLRSRWSRIKHETPQAGTGNRTKAGNHRRSVDG